MKKRFMLLVSCYLTITLATTFLISVPQQTLAEGTIGDPPILDTIQDTIGNNTSIPSSDKEDFKISFLDVLTSLINIRI